MRSTLVTAAASLLSLGTLVSADVPIARNCPSSDLCYSINVPDVTAKSGSGDIYLQIKAATSYSYAALGQGASMTGANIFVIYPSADGKNVTLSTRNGLGHRQPLYTSAVEAELLEGSGVADGMMTANIKCSNCNKWSGGSMDFSQSSTDWIYAMGSGTPFETDAKDATITYHGPTGRAPFTWDLSPAMGGNSVNPFLAAAATNATTTTTTTSSSSSAFSPSFVHLYERVRLAHGSLAGIAFVGLFPIGAILIRLASFKGVVWVHAAIQAIATILYVAAFGLGIWMWTSAPLDGHIHPIIGCVIFAVLLIQPLTGFLHHRFFVKRAKNAAAGENISSRTWSSYLHLFTGRAVVLLGIINGGLGLWLAQVMGSLLYAYSALAGIMGFAYIVAIIVGEWRRSKQLRQQRREQPAQTHRLGSGSTAGRSDPPMEQMQVRPKQSNEGNGSDAESPTVGKEHS